MSIAEETAFCKKCSKKEDWSRCQSTEGLWCVVFQGCGSHTTHKEANCRWESRDQGSDALGITVVYGSGILSAKIAMVWISGYLLLSSSSKFLYEFTVNFPINVFVWCFWAVSTNNYKVIVLSESLTWGPCCISLLSWITLVDRSVILRHKVRSLGLQFFFFPSTHATS